MDKKVGDGLKILILDDEKDICLFTKEYFIQRGFDVYTAAKSKTAMNHTKKVKPDIALLDIHLYKEEVTGIDVLKDMKQIHPDCYCIMVTRDDKKEQETQARKAGAFDYLTKLRTAKNLDKVILKAVKKIRKEGR